MRQEPSSSRHPWHLLVLVATAQAMVALDVTVVNVALPYIGEELSFDPGDLQWVVSIYVLITGALLLLGGRLVDLLGARRMFLTGLLVFVGASLASGLAGTSALLVVSRALQGVGATMLTPAALSVITSTYLGAQRSKALGAWSAITSGGAAAGLLVGGMLTTWADWRWVFFVNVPIGLLALAFGFVLVPRLPASTGRFRLDVPGAVSGTAAMLVIIYAISEAATYGWGSGRTIGLLVAGACLLVVFGVVEHRSPAPLVPPALWRERSLASSTVVMFGATTTLIGVLFLGIFALQYQLHTSALRTGLALLPMVAAIALAAHLSPGVLNHLGARWTATTGLLVAAGGTALLAVLPEGAGYARDLLPAFVLLGFGIGLTFTAVSVTSMADIGADRSGSASGLYMTAHDLGGAFGVAILSTVAIGGAGSLADLAGERRGFLAAAVITGFFALVALLTMPGYRPPVDPSGRSKVFGHGHGG